MIKFDQEHQHVREMQRRAIRQQHQERRTLHQAATIEELERERREVQEELEEQARARCVQRVQCGVRQ